MAYQTAVQYHFGHALGLLAVGVLLTLRPADGSLAVAAWLLVAGVVLFSGSLYVLALTGIRGLGVVTPFGIKVNAISPGAFTRLAASMMEDSSPLLQHARANLPAGLSSPAVALLAHEQCPVTGECIDSVGGEVWRSYMARTPGIADQGHTIEKLAARWDEVMAGACNGELGIASFDTADWQLKPYDGNP